MVLVKKDKYILGQSENGQIATMGEEIRLDLQLQPVTPIIGATVEGRVLDTNGAPIANALVKIMDNNYEPLLHAVTDTDGNYMFHNIPSSSSYTIFAIASGMKLNQGQSFSLSDGQSLTVDFTLENDPAMSLGIIAGDLYQTGTTTPINGAVVSLYSVVNGVETLSAITYTNQYGQFAFREVSIGSYDIKISALGYLPDSINTSITTSAEILSLQPTLLVDPNAANGTVSGIITNELNAPINRADVILYRVNADSTLTPVAFTKTNASGVYLFINVPQGTYKVKSNEFEIAEVNIEPPLGQGPNIDKLTLAEAVTVVPISVEGADGTLVGANILADGFVGQIGQESTGDSVTINVNIPLAGKYTMSIEHYNDTSRKLKTFVNGTLAFDEQVITTTGIDSSTSVILNNTIDLIAGSNSIKLMGGSDADAPNIGTITFDKNAFTGEFESRDGVLGNGAIVTPAENPAPGFVDLIGGTSDGSVSLTINIPLAGEYTLGIEHLNTEIRPLAIDINGVPTGTIYSVPATASFSTSDSEIFNVVVNLTQGNNIIKFHGNGTNTAPLLGTISYLQSQFLSLTEAENTSLGGSATINGEFVLNIGGTGNGYVEETKTVPYTGSYDFILSYVAEDATKTAKILVNGVDTGAVYTFEQTDSLNIADVKTKVIRLNLTAGSNTIRVI